MLFFGCYSVDENYKSTATIYLFNIVPNDTIIYKDTIECSQYTQEWINNKDIANCKVEYHTSLRYSDLEVSPDGLSVVTLISDSDLLIYSTEEIVKLESNFPEIDFTKVKPLMVPSDINGVKITQKTIVVK